MASKHIRKERISSVPIETKSSVVAKKSLVRTIATWIVWIIIYLLVFYLGNVTGEYVAAQMPIIPSLSRVSVSFPGMSALNKMLSNWGLSNVGQKDSSTSTTSATKTGNPNVVTVNGTVITVPEQNATDAQRQQFFAQVRSLAVVASTIKITSPCVLNPPVVLVKPGSSLTFVNASGQSHLLSYNSKQQSITSASIQVDVGEQVQTIVCDGQGAGFSLLEK